jgi:hypothetical protein
MLKTILLFTLISIGISCKKEKLEEYTGTIKDYTGMLDGCGIMIDLDNGNRLHPVSNLSGISLEKNKRVVITFRDKPAFNICMAGQTVEIVSLRYL